MYSYLWNLIYQLIDRSKDGKMLVTSSIISMKNQAISSCLTQHKIIYTELDVPPGIHGQCASTITYFSVEHDAVMTCCK